MMLVNSPSCMRSHSEYLSRMTVDFPRRRLPSEGICFSLLPMKRTWSDGLAIQPNTWVLDERRWHLWQIRTWNFKTYLCCIVIKNSNIKLNNRRSIYTILTMHIDWISIRTFTLCYVIVVGIGSSIVWLDPFGFFFQKWSNWKWDFARCFHR